MHENLQLWHIHKNRENDDKKLPPKVITAFWIAEILIILFCVMSYFAANDNSMYLRIISLIILSVTSIIFSIIILRIIFERIPEFPTISTLVYSRVNPYFENLNQMFSRRGIGWNITEDLYIEMKIGDEQQDIIEEENLDEMGNSESNCRLLKNF